jgi:arylsulfatase A-like enzyme
VRAASLFIVFAIAKIAILWDRDVPGSPWTPLAYLWQDLAVALLFWTADRALSRTRRGQWLARASYGALVLLAALTVPVARVLSSPLTMPMLRATRGTLGDSIRYHATFDNLAAVALVLGAGALVPRVLRPVRATTGRGAVALAIVMVLAGPFAAARVDTAGLDRNAIVALVQTSIPRVRPMAAAGEWRQTSAALDRSDTLAHLAGSARHYNVLLVVLESTGARYLRAYGAAEDPTPNLTKLAGRAVVFEHAYAVYPESVKGLVALLSSRYPAFDVPAERHEGMMSPSLASALSQHGYATALFHSGRFMYLGMDALVRRAAFDRSEDAGDIGGRRESSFGVDEQTTVHRILSWIDARRRNQPFFAAYLPIAGHHPYASSSPGPFDGDRDIDRYRNALFEGDAALGELLEGLRARNLTRSTLIVVLGDHGEAFGQHNGNYGHTLALYEENVRVPLIIVLPESPDIPRRVQPIASVIDVAPTVLDLVGVPPPDTFQGTSLLQADPREALFFTDYSLGMLGLRDGCFKYIGELESGRSRMFDVCRDPLEQRDLAGSMPDAAAGYRLRLREWSAAQVARVAVGGGGRH